MNDGDHQPSKEDFAIRLTFLESVLISAIVMLFLSGLGLGIGFYLGSQQVDTNTKEVLAICQRAMDADDGRIKAIMINYDAMQAELDKYRKFLVSTEGEHKRAMGGQ